MKHILLAALLAFMPMFANAAVTEITEDQFDKEMAAPLKPVVVEIYADWCGACQATAPMLEKAEAKYGKSVKFFKINIDTAPHLQQVVRSIPLIMYIPVKKENMDASLGMPESQKELEQRIEKLLK